MILKTISWEDCDLPAHTLAWMQAHQEFIDREHREPDGPSDLSRIAQRAEQIRRTQ